MTRCYRHIITGEVHSEEGLSARGISGGYLNFLKGLGLLKEVSCERIGEGKTADELDEEQGWKLGHIYAPFLISVEPITIEKLLLGMVLVKYMQTEAGRKHLADIAKEYLGVVGKTMSALSAAGASHPLASLIHGRITVSVYETLGLIPHELAMLLHSNFEDNINKIIAKDYLSEVIGGIGEIIPG